MTYIIDWTVEVVIIGVGDNGAGLAVGETWWVVICSDDIDFFIVFEVIETGLLGTPALCVFTLCGRFRTLLKLKWKEINYKSYY
jgi:hypothetical protein